jgi:hypothetical protein
VKNLAEKIDTLQKRRERYKRMLTELVSRLENEAVLDRMHARMVQHPDILMRRRETVEHPFGSVKQWTNQGAFPMDACGTCVPNSA